MLRQLLYLSVADAPDGRVAVEPIYEQSRHNNALEGVTGLLLTDGRRFCQLLEGSDEAVAATLERIRRDPRHRGIEVLRDEAVAAREFGQWFMADRRRGERADEFDERLRLYLRHAEPATRDIFLEMLHAPA